MLTVSTRVTHKAPGSSLKAGHFPLTRRLWAVAGPVKAARGQVRLTCRDRSCAQPHARLSGDTECKTHPTQGPQPSASPSRPLPGSPGHLGPLGCLSPWAGCLRLGPPVPLGLRESHTSSHMPIVGVKVTFPVSPISFFPLWSWEEELSSPSPPPWFCLCGLWRGISNTLPQSGRTAWKGRSCGLAMCNAVSSHTLMIQESDPRWNRGATGGLP